MLSRHAVRIGDRRAKRWRVAGDGTAVNLHRARQTNAGSRISTCPAKPAPGGGSLLLAIWRQQRQATSAQD
jgi:hypothetical protein